MIELKRLKLINWHNFENVTFDCARLTYMIGVNAVGKTTILDAIRYCLAWTEPCRVRPLFLLPRALKLRLVVRQ